MSLRNRILLIVFLLLVGSVLAVEQPWRGDEFAKTRAKVQRLFPELDRQREQIARITIQSRDHQTTLIKTPIGWVVEEMKHHPADGYRLAALLSRLINVTNRDVISVNPEKRSTFAVKEGDGTRIELFDEQGSSLACLISGSMRGQEIVSGSKTLLEFYIRRCGTDEVILSDFRAPVVRARDWLKASLMNTADGRPLFGQNVSWIARQSPEEGESWRIVRGEQEGDPDWSLVLPEEGPAQKLAADDIAHSLATARAIGVAQQLTRHKEGEAPDPSFGIAPNGEIFQVGIGEERYEIAIGKITPDGEGRYAWIPGNPWVYVVAEATAARFRLALEEIAATE